MLSKYVMCLIIVIAAVLASYFFKCIFVTAKKKITIFILGFFFFSLQNNKDKLAHRHRLNNFNRKYFFKKMFVVFKGYTWQTIHYVS